MIKVRNLPNLSETIPSRRLLGSCFLILLGVLFGTVPAAADIIELNTILSNPSFEGSSAGCPTSWICDGSPGFGGYSPTASQYTPGADGLPGSLTTPNGTQVAYGPSGWAGSGIIRQTSNVPWVAGNTYTYTFWLGIPNTEPDGTTPIVGPPTGALRLYFLADSVGARLPQYDLIAPQKGQWEKLTYTVTPEQLADSGGMGHNVGAMFFVSTNSPYETANFDTVSGTANNQSGTNPDAPTDPNAPIDPNAPTAPVPEPGSFGLGILVIAATWLASRRAAAH